MTIDNEHMPAEDEDYHFSEDAYGEEPELEAKAMPAHTPKSNAVEKLKQFRKPLIGAAIAVVLLFVVYRVITPNAPPPATDFSQKRIQPTAAARSAPAQTMVPAQTMAPAQTIVKSPAGTNTAGSPTGMSPALPVQNTAALSQANPIAMPMPTTTPVPEANQQLVTLKEQNQQLLSLMQAQNSQKLTDMSAQQTAMQNKMQELTMRVANIEDGLAKINELLKNVSATSPTTSSGSNNSSTSSATNSQADTSPKNSYTVQAIIPGRAWLKSDKGDVITVAQGDTLEGYGQITKLDPDAGTVEINTGKSVVTLDNNSGN